jgi:hypothetical protein
MIDAVICRLSLIKLCLITFSDSIFNIEEMEDRAHSVADPVNPRKQDTLNKLTNSFFR